VVRTEAGNRPAEEDFRGAGLAAAGSEEAGGTGAADFPEVAETKAEEDPPGAAGERAAPVAGDRAADRKWAGVAVEEWVEESGPAADRAGEGWTAVAYGCREGKPEVEPVPQSELGWEAGQGREPGVVRAPEMWRVGCRKEQGPRQCHQAPRRRLAQRLDRTSPGLRWVW